MGTINVHEAKTHLSRLLEGVLKGGSYVIAKAGKPVARLVPLDQELAAVPRRLGFLAGQFTTPGDFDHMGSSEIERQFGGQD